MINNLVYKYRAVVNMLNNHYAYKHVGYINTVKNYINNRNETYRIYKFDEVKRFKNSNTIFILGSGPSLNNLTQDNIKVINRHDSFGINYSFLLDDIVPTYYQMEYGRREKIVTDTFKNTFKKRRKAYRDTLFCLNHKEKQRVVHPRILPEYFSEYPKIYYYKLPKPIILEKLREFTDDDFNKTVYYRGSLTLVLNLVINMGYSRIVLLGVNPDTSGHFYDDYDCMSEYVKSYEGRYNIKSNKSSKYENMTTNAGKPQPIDNYLYSLYDYLFRVHNVKLYVDFKSNMLASKIPVFFNGKV